MVLEIILLSSPNAKIFIPLSNFKLAMLFVKGTCNEKSSQAICQHILHGAEISIEIANI